ncbi:HAD-IIA family hydrolase [Haloechinothrix salitolerans]|uniref:HAD-IIA family hydrolase n=1 Tax=Haloechinothrix salitolerans TaxID=926830 RepID=A0ABW2BZL2_9PSEU
MAQPLLDRYDCLLLDLDGTVYHGSEAIKGAISGIDAAHAKGVAVRFVTNNASKAPDAVASHLRHLDVPARTEEVATSAQAGARLLGQMVPAGAMVLVVGTEALAAEVNGVGLRTTRTYSDDVAAVVQGHSPDTAWADLAEACTAIRSGARWVACNVDPTLPTERGQLPGNGSMVAALRTATGASPDVAGKPEPGLFTEAARAADARSPLVVGDRLDTDVAGAEAAGMDAMLVLSGVTTPAEILAAPEGQRPRYLADDVAAVTSTAEALAVGARPDWRIDVGDDELRVAGSGEPLDLLRALCPLAWRHGISRASGTTDTAKAVVNTLGVGDIDYR